MNKQEEILKQFDKQFIDEQKTYVYKHTAREIKDFIKQAIEKVEREAFNRGFQRGVKELPVELRSSFFQPKDLKYLKIT